MFAKFEIWGSRLAPGRKGQVLFLNPAFVASVEMTGNMPAGCRIRVQDKEYVVYGTVEEVHEQLEMAAKGTPARTM